jgi:hypothetical protein
LYTEVAINDTLCISTFDIYIYRLLFDTPFLRSCATQISIHVLFTTQLKGVGDWNQATSLKIGLSS